MQKLQKFEQRKGVRCAAPDVEGHTRDTLDIFDGGDITSDEIINEQNVSHLLACAVKRNWTLELMRDGEPRDPTLIFDSKLPVAVDARLPEVDRAQPVNPGVIVGTVPGMLPSGSPRRILPGTGTDASSPRV